MYCKTRVASFRLIHSVVQRTPTYRTAGWYQFLSDLFCTNIQTSFLFSSRIWCFGYPVKEVKLFQLGGLHVRWEQNLHSCISFEFWRGSALVQTIVISLKNFRSWWTAAGNCLHWDQTSLLCPFWFRPCAFCLCCDSLIPTQVYALGPT